MTNATRRSGRLWLLLGGAALVGAAGLYAWHATDRSSTPGATQAGAVGEYPAPRFLAALLEPTADDLLRAARIAVRQTHGMSPLGNIERGDSVHVVLPASQDMAVWDAIQKAWAERGVKAIGVRPWEIIGEDEAAYVERANANLLRGGEAWKEIGVFDPAYYPLFSPAIQKQMGEPMRGRTLHKHLKGFLERNPDIKHFFSDPGGGANWIGVAIGPQHRPKFAGNWTYLSANNLVNKSSAYPGDLWNMVEDKLIAPIEHVSEGTFTDPEGTDLRWEITPEQARKWKQYVALVNNHMFMYPQPTETQRFGGKVSGTANHTGFYPAMTVHLSDRGRVTSVEGGGKAGDLFRILLDHPKLKDVQFPTTPEKGYWYLAADGFATNPKKVRDMETLINGSSELPNMSERERAGVMHLSFSSGAGNYEISLADVQKAIAEGKQFIGPKNADVRDMLHAHKYNIPMGHTAHVHNYFGTMKWKLRDTGEWITLSDKGRITAFDDPEVRALASRYGDPEAIFSYDWIPGIPGINMDGNYEEYARDPWKWVNQEYDQIKSGKYPNVVSDYDMIRAPAEKGAPAPKK